MSFLRRDDHRPSEQSNRFCICSHETSREVVERKYCTNNKAQVTLYSPT
jgi:hypothetical protein